MTGGIATGPEEPTQTPAPPTAPPTPPPQGSLRRNLLIAGIGTVAVLVGVVAYVLFALRGTKDVLVEMVPSSAIGYVTVYLDPAAEQKVKLRNLAGKFPALEGTDLSRRIDEALDDGLSAIGLTAADVRPWLGSQIGVAVRFTGVEEPATVFMIRSKDDAAARRALDKFRRGPEGSKATWEDERYGGVTLSSGSNSKGEVGAYALLEHTVISANDPKLLRDVVDARQGKIDDLGSSDAFEDATAALPDGRLGLAYVSVGPLLDSLRGVLGAAGGPTADPGLDQIEALRGMALSVSAKSDGVGADLTVVVDRSKLTEDQRQVFATGGHENAALAFTPDSAYGVIAMTGFRASMEALLQRASEVDPTFGEADIQLGLSDAIRHLTGDAALEVRPGASGFPGGAWLIGTDDEATMQRLLERATDMLGSALADPFSQAAPTVRHETYRGVDIATLEVVGIPELTQFGVQPAYALSDGMAIIGSSPAEVRAALDAKRGPSLTDGERFREAVAEAPGDRRFLVYLDVQAISAAVRTALDPNALEEFDREVAPNLTPVRRFILNSDNEADRMTIRMFVLIQ